MVGGPLVDPTPVGSWDRDPLVDCPNRPSHPLHLTLGRGPLNPGVVRWQGRA